MPQADRKRDSDSRNRPTPSVRQIQGYHWLKGIGLKMDVKVEIKLVGSHHVTFPFRASTTHPPRAKGALRPPRLSRRRGPYLNPGASLDKFVALDTDKCALVYLLLRGTGARYVVEAGTSFGLSTIYLALAVGQNAAAAGGSEGKVIATEMEASKAARARAHWALAGPEVEPWIELREGDLRETLKKDLPAQVDFLFLDIWTPMALPALKLVHPHLKKGAIIVADNVEVAKDGYRELLEYIGKPENGIKATSIPFSGGLGFYVYLGQE
ncbi:S-adenosyl-L-methionine-dependent methyltransferase [Mycena galopus ATCC 62051]|nr:S-adenosyl-L-methionine-dependent methyltransferase [Mycena galopus ATCC 62051]